MVKDLKLRLVLAAFLACLVLPSTLGFSPISAFPGAHGAMKLRTHSQQRPAFVRGPALRMSSEPPSEPPAEGGEVPGDETVDISVEELKELAEKAGINVKFASELQQQAGGAPEAPEETGPSVFQPVIDAAAPVTNLPQIVAYPILLLAIGFVSAVFLPFFGSATLGDIAGVKKGSDTTAAAPAPAPAPAPKKEEKVKSSCDIFPYSLTPTCTDPNIGEKAILKNLDKYKKVPDAVLKERAAKEAAAAAKAAESAAE